MTARNLPSFVGGTPGGLTAGAMAALGISGRGFDAWALRPARALADFAREQVWQGSTAFQALPGVAGALDMVSTVGGDIGGGVGARTLEAVYLNASFELRLARGTMDGLVIAPFDEVDVPSNRSTGNPVLDAVRLLAVRIETVGAGGTNAGIITCDIGGVEQAVMTRATPATTLLANRAQPAFTVPTGFIAVLDTFESDSGPVIALEAREQRPASSPFVAVQSTVARSLAGVEALGQFRQVDPLVFPSGTDLRLVYQSIRAESLTAYTAPRAQFYLAPDAEGPADSDPDQRPHLARYGWI